MRIEIHSRKRFSITAEYRDGAIRSAFYFTLKSTDVFSANFDIRKHHTATIFVLVCRILLNHLTSND